MKSLSLHDVSTESNVDLLVGDIPALLPFEEKINSENNSI
jgi:hypothetical protein